MMRDLFVVADIDVPHSLGNDESDDLNGERQYLCSFLWNSRPVL
jgi:hypothetical protein